MKKSQLSVDHLSIIKLYFQPQKSKDIMLNQMAQSQLVMKGKIEFEYESKVLGECIEFLNTVSNDELQQLDFSEVLDYEEVVE